MYWLKSCPRCHGDLLEVDDIGGRYVSCIQCGKVLTAAQEQALPRANRPREARRVGRAGGRPAA